MTKSIWIIGLIAINATIIHGLIGYDCGGDPENIKTFSAKKVGECNIPFIQPNETQKNIQLIQLTKHDYVEVIECSVKVDRDIKHCGMFSHVGNVRGGRQIYQIDLDYRGCKNLFTSGSIRISESVTINGLKANETTIRTVQLAGSTSVDSSCKGTQYSDRFGTYEDVLVEAVVEIYYSTYKVRVNVERDQVELKTGVRCAYPDGNCLDVTGSRIYWETQPGDSCGFQQYQRIYEGKATKLSATDEEQEVYLINNVGISIALMAKRRVNVCGYAITQTELSDLFIIEAPSDNIFPKVKPIEVQDLDMFLYINAKFLLTERNTRKQIKEVYHEIRIRECELEREILKGALRNVRDDPELFAQDVMKGPGYYAVVAGAVIHIVKCKPIKTKIRPTNECYQEIPVTYENQSYWLTADAYTLVRKGTPIECNSLLPIGQEIDNKFYYFSPQPMSHPFPEVLKPRNDTYRFTKSNESIEEGLYDKTKITSLRDRIMSAQEAKAILHNMARGTTGYVITQDDISIKNLLNTKGVQEMIEEKMEKFWNKVMIFGTTVSSIIGIISILQILRMVINTFIHAHTLHEFYGWSIHLIAALFDALTYKLVRPRGATRLNEERDVERGTSEMHNARYELDPTSGEETTTISTKKTKIRTATATPKAPKRKNTKYQIENESYDEN